VLVILGLWHSDLLPRAKRLRFIQSIGAGTDQFLTRGAQLRRFRNRLEGIGLVQVSPRV
jgi:phosphoglycerate dehydrogenase-like enzyme